MAGFIQGLDRHQSVQCPARLEDYISAENPVRVVDAYIESLDLPVLGFDCSEPGPLGAPRYHPATLLKLYVYGYLNRINSSRRLKLIDGGVVAIEGSKFKAGDQSPGG